LGALAGRDDRYGRFERQQELPHDF
jgi:hypothetical protein